MRPTLKCLSDIDVKLPSLNVPLHEMEHVVIRSAQSVPERVETYSAERIVSLTDRVWFKDRAGQWRSAVARPLNNTGDDETTPVAWWIGAAGLRRAGKADEPYDSWLREAQAAGSKHHPSTEHWIPTANDWDRWALERAVVEEAELADIVPRLIAMSLRGRRGYSATRGDFDFVLEVRANAEAEVYLAVFARGIPNTTFADRLAALLDSVPGVAKDDWQPEPVGSSPFRGIAPGVVAWSTLLAPETQVMLLDQYPDDVEVNDVA